MPLKFGCQISEARKLLQLTPADFVVLTSRRGLIYTINHLATVEREDPLLTEMTVALEPFFALLGVTFDARGGNGASMKERHRSVPPPVLARRYVKRYRREMLEVLTDRLPIYSRGYWGARLMARIELLRGFDAFRGDRAASSVIERFVTERQGQSGIRFSRRSIERWLAVRNELGEAALGDNVQSRVHPSSFERQDIMSLIAELAIEKGWKPQAIAFEVCNRFPQEGLFPSAAAVRRVISKIKSLSETRSPTT